MSQQESIAQLIGVVRELIQDSAEGRAQLEALAQSFAETEGLEARTELFKAVVSAQRDYDRDIPVEPSETQGRTMFSYAVMSGLLGRGTAVATRVKVVRSAGNRLEFAPLTPTVPFPANAESVWVRAADGRIEVADLALETGKPTAIVRNIPDGQAIHQIELRTAANLPIALAGAVAALP